LVRKFNRLELGRSRGETFPTHALSSSQTTAGGTSGPAWRRALPEDPRRYGHRGTDEAHQRGARTDPEL